MNQSGSSHESNPLCHVQRNKKSKGITSKGIQDWFWRPAHLSLDLHTCVIYNTWGWTKLGILTLEFSIIFKKFWCPSPNYWLGYFLGFLKLDGCESPVNSGSWWWTGRPGMLRFMGSQRVRHDWATDLIWSDTTLGIVNFKICFSDSNAQAGLKTIGWEDLFGPSNSNIQDSMIIWSNNTVSHTDLESTS